MSDMYGSNCPCVACVLRRAHHAELLECIKQFDFLTSKGFKFNMLKGQYEIICNSKAMQERLKKEVLAPGYKEVKKKK